MGKTTTMDKERPFRPSWVDRFNNWVKRLPIRAWLFFLVVGSILVLVQILPLWLESGLQDIELLPIIIFNGFFTPFLLGLMYLLDNQAATALNSMKPVLDTTESELEHYQYVLSNMPQRASLMSGLTMLVLAILMEQLWIAPARYAALAQLPIFTVVFQIVDKSSAFLFGVFIYHTIRQLRMVSTINSKPIRISLYNLAPLQAFSRLTASTAVGLVVGVYAWMLINPDLLRDPIAFGFMGLITILAVAVFVWPLFGVHRRLETEKERLLHALDSDFEALFSEFNEAFRAEDYSAIERMNGTIASLDIQRNRIEAIPTWPWRPETAQFVFAAIALPVVLAVLQFLVEQAFD